MSKSDKKDARERCACVATFGYVGRYDGHSRSATCKCNIRVVHPGDTCGMCQRGIHGTGIVWKVASTY